MGEVLQIIGTSGLVVFTIGIVGFTFYIMFKEGVTKTTVVVGLVYLSIILLFLGEFLSKRYPNL